MISKKPSSLLAGATAFAATMLLATIAFSASATYSIPEDQLDHQKIYFGNSVSFEKPAKIKIDEILKATPEFDEIKKKKVERGTGKYWILVSQAQERSQEAINAVGQETDYDLICEDGYLDALEPAIPSDDITEKILEKLEE